MIKSRRQQQTHWKDPAGRHQKNTIIMTPLGKRGRRERDKKNHDWA